MNRIAFVFIYGSHAYAAGREGLDALLATAILSEEIGVFFISDGILLLLAHQQPDQILARDFVSTFGVLSLYDIDKLYLCSDSVEERGLAADANWVLKATCLPAKEWRRRLDDFDIVLTF